jgi:uncharacterized membrane protein (DUF2068 family)
VFEAIKGILVLMAGLGMLSLLHKDVGEAALHVVHQLHINPARHISRVFLEAAGKVNDAKLWSIAAGAAAYSTVRFLEAYGLWNRRVWAEWFALLSGMLYLPFEVYELAEKATYPRLIVFGINVVIVIYMAEIRLRASLAHEQAD